MNKRAKHPADFAVVAGPLDRNFSGSMAQHCGQWVARYTCQTCGRKTGWLAENYLGGNPLVCTGDRLWRPHEQTRAKLGDDAFRSLIKRSENCHSLT